MNAKEYLLSKGKERTMNNLMQKAKAVIDSCTNHKQVLVAHKFLEQAYKITEYNGDGDERARCKTDFNNLFSLCLDKQINLPIYKGI